MNIICEFIGSNFPLKKTRCQLELGAWTNVLEHYHVKEELMDFTLGGVESTEVAYMIDADESKATETTWEGPLTLDTYHYVKIDLSVYGFGTLKVVTIIIPWVPS